MATVEADYYAILGIRQGAEMDEIKRAFRRLAPLCHPDKNPQDPNACGKFIRLREAYETLTDSNRRILYDVRYEKWKREREASTFQQNVGKENPERERAEKLRLSRENLIAQIKVDMDKLDKEIKEIKRRAKERETKEREEEERSASKWWNFFTWTPALGTEEEKMNRKRDNLHQLASERIKLERLAQSMTKLQRNLDEQKEAMNKEMREYILRQRMEEERAAREREIREREKKQREETERVAREKAASEKAAKEREKRMREETERIATMEREMKERDRKFREEMRRMARQRELDELDARAKAAEKPMEGQRNHAAPRRTERSNRPSSNMAQKSACRHDKFWPKVEGDRCGVCFKFYRSFILQCPDCQMRACAACRNQLKHSRQ